MLVHGSVVGGRLTWGAQLPLADRFDLVIPNRRGFPPNPPVGRVDFEDEAVRVAELLDRPSHLAGHSYGALISLLAAARRPDAVRSLTAVEPPVLGIARGHPAVDDQIARFEELWSSDRGDAESFLRRFIEVGGLDFDPPSPLPPAIEQGARMLMVEREPWTATLPFDALAAAPFPTLCVSGGWNPAFEAVCDVLQERIGAERAVLPGAGHSIQRLGEPFNALLAAFVERAERALADPPAAP